MIRRVDVVELVDARGRRFAFAFLEYIRDESLHARLGLSATAATTSRGRTLHACGRLHLALEQRHALRIATSSIPARRFIPATTILVVVVIIRSVIYIALLFRLEWRVGFFRRTISIRVV